METGMRVFMILLASSALAWGQASQPLRLEKTIEFPEVQGRIDHMSVDVKGQRLFVSALGNNTVEVIDVKAGKRVKTISGLAEAQGVLYVPGNDRLYVANAKDGSVRIFVTIPAAKKPLSVTAAAASRRSTMKARVRRRSSTLIPNHSSLKKTALAF